MFLLFLLDDKSLKRDPDPKSDLNPYRYLIVTDPNPEGPKPVFRIHDILVWIRMRIRGSMPLTNGSGFGSGFWIRIRILDPDPAIFVIHHFVTFKMPTKN